MMKLCESRFGLIIVVMTVVISTVVTSYIAGQESGIARFSAATDSPLSQQLILLRGGIALCFLLMFLALYFRFKNAALILLALAVMILAGYFWWYFDTLNLVRNLGGLSEVGEGEISRIGYLRTSNWWDFVVLVETIVLALCAMLDFSFSRRGSESKTDASA